jgi:hypothetical protein
VISRPALLGGLLAFGLAVVAAGCRMSGRARHERPIVLPTHTFVRFETPDGRRLNELLHDSAAPPDAKVDFRAGVIAIATHQPPGERLRATTHADHRRHELGSWELPNWKERTTRAPPERADGTVLTDIAPPFFISAVVRDEVLQTKEVRVQDSIVTFVIDPAEVRARLGGFRLRVVAGGQPVERASVELTDAGSGGGGWKTDSDGRLAVANYLSGILILRIEAAGQGRIERWVRLASGRVTDLGEIALEPAAVIEGRVLDPDGNPVPALMRFRYLDELGSPQAIDELQWSGMRAREGRFVRGECRRGRHLVFATSAFATRVLVVDTSTGDVRGLDVRLERGTNVTFEGGPEDRWRLVEIRDGAGLPVTARRLWSPPRFEILLAPGPYTLSVFDDETLVRREEFVVGTEPATIGAGRVPSAR